MKPKVQPIPADYRAATPYLIIRGAADAIEFYKKAFGAAEYFRMAGPDGRIAHAEIRIDNRAIIMLADEVPDECRVGTAHQGRKDGLSEEGRAGSARRDGGESSARPSPSPKTLGGSPVSLYIYVEDVDALAQRAEAAGAKLKRPVADQFYGDRSVILEDPYGHTWGFATHIEDLTSEELNKRAAARARDERKK